MLQKSIYSSLLSLSEANNIEKKNYRPGDIVLDHESSHILYLFATGWYTVWSESPFGTMHEVGQIDAPSTLGE